VSRYGGEIVEDESALVMRIEKLAEDRDCWLANAKANQKEYQRMEGRFRANDQSQAPADATPNTIE
jgi:hypothetical protein